MNAFVGGNLEKADAIRQFSQIEGARRLGFALHAIMDSTSPAHRRFQKWQLSEAPRHGDFPFTSEENEGVVGPYIPGTVQKMLDAMKGGNLDCSCY